MPRVQTTEGFGRLVHKFVAVGYDDPKKRHVVVDDPKEVEGMAALFAALVDGALLVIKRFEKEGTILTDPPIGKYYCDRKEYESRMMIPERPILIIEEP